VRLRTSPILGLSICSLALALGIAPALSEVGVVGLGPGRSGRIILGQNPEGPDPFLVSWTPVINLPADLTVNRQGDTNGDGPAAFGFSDSPVPAPPTFTWALKTPAGDHDPVFAQFIGGAWSAPIVIASGPGDDLDPAWFQDAAGRQHAAWWRAGAAGAGGMILHAWREPGQPAFSAEEIVSAPGEAARNPSLTVLPSGEVLIAYETDSVLGVRRVIVASKDLGSGGYQRQVLAESSYSGSLSPEVGARAGKAWVSWIDSTSAVGYSRRTDGEWMTPSGAEPYQGANDAPRARITARSRMIAP
jgi:hypothetical protein